MKHDLDHERTQNDVIEKLASMVAVLCQHVGLKGEAEEAFALVASLKKDDAIDAPEESPVVVAESISAPSPEAATS